MLRATAIVRRLAVKAERVADRITLDHRTRSAPRTTLTAERGLSFEVALAAAPALKHGDAYKLDDGRLVEIIAAPEPLIEITAGSAGRLARIAWHIGGRHAAVEATPDAIYVAADPGLAELARGLGGQLKELSRPFEPEKTIDDCGHDHGPGGHGHHHHDHHHDHQHGHDRAHQDHGTGARSSVGHSHGPGERAHHGVASAGDHDHAHQDCGCGHDHEHHTSHDGHGHGHGHHHGEARGDGAKGGTGRGRA